MHSTMPCARVIPPLPIATPSTNIVKVVLFRDKVGARVGPARTFLTEVRTVSVLSHHIVHARSSSPVMCDVVPIVLADAETGTFTVDLCTPTLRMELCLRLIET